MFVSGGLCVSLGTCVCVCVKPWRPELQTINGGVTTKQEAGMAQGDRLLGPSLAAAES